MQYHDHFLTQHARSRLADLERSANRRRLLYSAGLTTRARVSALLSGWAQALAPNPDAHPLSADDPANGSMGWPAARL